MRGSRNLERGGGGGGEGGLGGGGGARQERGGGGGGGGKGGRGGGGGREEGLGGGMQSHADDAVQVSYAGRLAHFTGNLSSICNNRLVFYMTQDAHGSMWQQQCHCKEVAHAELALSADGWLMS